MAWIRPLLLLCVLLSTAVALYLVADKLWIIFDVTGCRGHRDFLKRRNPILEHSYFRQGSCKRGPLFRAQLFISQNYPILSNKFFIAMGILGLYLAVVAILKLFWGLSRVYEALISISNGDFYIDHAKYVSE